MLVPPNHIKLFMLMEIYVHQTAEKKPTEKLDQKIDYKEEFPF